MCPLSRVHGVTIGPKAENLYQEVNDLLAEYGVHTPEGSLVKASEILDIIEGYIGKAYGCSTEAELGQNYSCVRIKLHNLYICMHCRWLLHIFPLYSAHAYNLSTYGQFS